LALPLTVVGNFMNAFTIAVANQKGGVGKTTTTKILGTLLAQTDFRLLLVDFDTQANLTEDLNFDPEALAEAGKTIFLAMLQRCSIAEMVIGDNPALVPSSIELAGIEPELIANAFIARGNLLRNLLEPQRTKYDFILIDTQPSLGLLAVNALAAADAVLIPVATQRYSTSGIRQLLKTIDNIRDGLNPELMVFGILPTKYRHWLNNDKAHLEAITALADQYGLRIFEPVKSATAFDAKETNCSVAIKAHHPSMQAYQKVAQELIHYAKR
jgi:chromosome partitioning protein